jgi:trk/ktr system potassium uptake protein
VTGLQTSHGPGPLLQRAETARSDPPPLANAQEESTIRQALTPGATVGPTNERAAQSGRSPRRLAPARKQAPVVSRFGPIFYVVGLLLVGLGGVMLALALADLNVANSDWRTFMAAGMTTVFFGGALALANRGDAFNLDVSQGFMLTTMAWLAVVAAGALPFIFSRSRLSVTDAFFESMSGFTTTGSTVIVGLDQQPPGLLLWRSLTQWIGGLGIVVMAIIMLPFLRVGGMQLFRTESSERSDKIFPRAVEMGRWIGSTYLLLTLLCTIALRLAGMSWFDASNHAMTTLATGGFSTRDASIGFYHSPAIEWVEVVFMTCGALPLTFYIRGALQGPRSMLEDGQVWVFLGALGTAVLAMASWVGVHLGAPASEALRLAAFNVTSILTDTGFASTDYGQWGSFAIGGFFLFYFVGGCAGSTAGAIKIFRWRILFSSARSQFHIMRRPHEVTPATYGGRRLPPELMGSVVNFFFLYILTFATLSLAMMLFDVEFLSSVSGVAQAMANAGPGLGDVIGPAGNFASLPDPAKWIVSFAMLLGRLELFTILVLVTPSFWRS